MRYENSPCHILLIEDNKIDIELIERSIQQADPSVRLDLAPDGDQALEYLSQWKAGSPTPILILLDLKLPGVDGLQVLQAIKTHAGFRTVPVVILTALVENKNLEQAYRLGANSYIMKAIDSDEFGKSIGLIHRYWCKLNIHP